MSELETSLDIIIRNQVLGFQIFFSLVWIPLCRTRSPRRMSSRTFYISLITEKHLSRVNTRPLESPETSGVLSDPQL